MGFSKDFVWGAATASYQIEGAAFEDGKGKNIWDVFTRKEGNVYRMHNGDIACDHYHRFKDDIALMKELHVKAYRFSISWSRILPEGTGKVNEAGIKFYDELIDELIANDIVPYITLYHWDLPYALHLKGGWLNRDIVDYFEEYTKLVVKHFGDRVKNFFTFNEPQVFVGCGYLQGSHAPGYTLADDELLIIGHNVMLANGKSVRVLREAIPDVNIGIAIATSPSCPVNGSSPAAAEKRYAYCGKGDFVFTYSYWFDPIIKGDFPQTIKDAYPDFFNNITKEDMDIIHSGIDYIGLNIYTGTYVDTDETGKANPIKMPDGSPRTAINWDVTPEALYWGPKFLYDRYSLPIYISENGLSCTDIISLDGKVHDPNRIDFLHRYIREFEKAADDGVNCAGYFQWSLMDNFEWARGYDERFGIIYVDYASQKRIIKDSGYWYRDVIDTNGENL